MEDRLIRSRIDSWAKEVGKDEEHVTRLQRGALLICDALRHHPIWPISEVRQKGPDGDFMMLMNAVDGGRLRMVIYYQVDNTLVARREGDCDKIEIRDFVCGSETTNMLDYFVGQVNKSLIDKFENDLIKVDFPETQSVNPQYLVIAQRKAELTARLAQEAKPLLYVFDDPRLRIKDSNYIATARRFVLCAPDGKFIDQAIGYFDEDSVVADPATDKLFRAVEGYDPNRGPETQFRIHMTFPNSKAGRQAEQDFAFKIDPELSHDAVICEIDKAIEKLERRYPSPMVDRAMDDLHRGKRAFSRAHDRVFGREPFPFMHPKMGGFYG